MVTFKVLIKYWGPLSAEEVFDCPEAAGELLFEEALAPLATLLLPLLNE
ncbi:hypothetical protein KDK_65340 [Dictyobacter kobayashii]|uniref:Uncharacterized protein n=1 Tax=Dictyobacter kobayashii TaxID=2014872 RepID=A0A402AUG3_9CHLR|nr:hypothetical protein KDK_65340 [Dictyobacter kobayashii]